MERLIRALILLAALPGFVFDAHAGSQTVGMDLDVLQEAPEPRIWFGPIAGFTTVPHPIPASESSAGRAFAFPLGSKVRFEVRDLGPRQSVLWEDLDSESDSVEIDLNRPGPMFLRCTILPDRARVAMPLLVIPLAPDQMEFTEQVALQQPFKARSGVSNQESVEDFFGYPSVADLARIDGRLTTSTGTPLRFSASGLELAGSATWDHLLEWVIDGNAVGSGEMSHVFQETGLHHVSVGPAQVRRELELMTYDVSIELVGEKRIRDDRPVTFIAHTDPPGYEDLVQWFASTLEGSVSPSAGTGARFETRFRSTWLGTGKRWVGVRADNEMEQQDFHPRSLSGTIFQVPCYPLQQLDFFVSATRTSSNTVNFFLALTNSSMMDMNLVVCAMLDLKFGSVEHEVYKVEKDFLGEWSCSQTGTGSLRPSYHFGCKRVFLPANTSWIVFDDEATFDKDGNGSIDDVVQADLARVYFDILKDCEIDDSCDSVVGRNKFLVPESPDFPEWVNVWAGHSRFALLDESSHDAQISWQSGNWVTMGYPGTYPARMTGEVSGLPAGSRFEFVYGDELGGSYLVPASRDGSGVGRSVAVDEKLTITEEPGVDHFLNVYLPGDSGEVIEEGQVVRFDGTVFAREGAPYYEEGDLMHKVSVQMVQDTQPPIFLDTKVQRSGSSVGVSMAAIDMASRVGGAFVRTTAPDGSNREIPLGRPSRGSTGFVSVFEGTLDFVDPSQDLELVVVDSIGNERSEVVRAP